jgi:hypothetical protein
VGYGVMVSLVVPSFASEFAHSFFWILCDLHISRL